MGDEPTLASIDKKLAIICERQTHQQEQQADLNKKIDAHLEKSEEQTKELVRMISQADDYAKAAGKTADTNKEEIDRLRSKSNFLDMLLAVGTLVLGAMGIKLNQ